MSCVLSSAISKPCGNGKSGVKKMWAVEHAALATIAETAGVVTTLTLDGGKSFYGWEMEPGQGTFNSPIQRNRANGTTFYEHKATVKFNRYETTKRNEILIIASADILLIALDKNGKYWLLGKENGLSLESGQGTSGQAMGDFSGFELAFTGEENELPVEINSTVISGLSLS